MHMSLSLAATLSTSAALLLESRRSLLALPVLVTPLCARSDEVLHILDYPKQGSCGEALIPDAGIPFVKAFGGLESGSCASAGYSVKEGEENGTGERDKDRTYTVYGKG